jgi:hypothetical protein
MITLLRRRDPVRPGVAIVDGTAAGVGEDVRTTLAGNELPARLITPFDLPEPVAVLLLPALAPFLPEPAVQLVAVIDALAADRRARFPTRLVLTWCVDPADRARLATPRPVTRNWSPLLLGTAWPRELTQHAGDRPAAATCLSAQIATLMRAHQTLAGLHIPTLCRSVRTLDPNFLHALAISGLDPASLAATVHTRLASPAART